MVIDDILQESAQYYQARQRRLLGAILMAPPGSPCLRRRAGGGYWYLRTYAGGQERREVYLGREDEPWVSRLLGRIERRRSALVELREVNRALKKLGEKGGAVARHDLHPIVREVFIALGKEGMWRAGAMLVGSWCFMVYQNYCGVEFFPLRTLDIDIAVELPYRGDDKDLGALFESLGFRQEYNRAGGSVTYETGEIKVELLSELKGEGRKKKNPQVKKSGVAPTEVRYLSLLFDNPMRIKIKGVGEVSAPSLAAFFLHKLLVAGERKEPAKQEKDLLQAAAAAKSLARPPELRTDLQRIWDGLPQGWRKRILKQKSSLQHLPADDAGAALGLLGG
ncbi:MAG: hypothetical protein C4525_06475 [Desulfarculus sp.]|jgi:hypothetical protein|nr:MAG: hypothetical protein C4525_06475 [Desulfarculus sp.]